MGLPPLVHDPAKVPPGRQVRRLTARIEDARGGRGVGAVLHDLWYAVVTLAACVAFVAGVATTIQDTTRAANDGPDLVGELPAVLVVLAGAGALLGLVGRLGPVALGGGGSAWWLPMPVDRRGLLRPAVLRWPATAVVVGGVGAPVVAITLGLPVAVGPVLAWAGLGGGGFAVLTAAAVALQGAGPRQAGERAVATTGDAAVLVAVLGVAVLALTGRTGDAGWELHTAWWVALPFVLVAVGLTWWAERRSERLPGGRLRALGSVGERAQVAVLSLDLRELSRALTVGDVRSSRRSRRLPARGPWAGIATADALLLLRTPRGIAQVGVLAVLALGASRTALLGSGLALYAVLLLTGFWAANAAAAGARHAELAPVLDRLLPLSARQVRVARGGVPLVAALVWCGVVLGGQAGTSSRGPDAGAWWAVVLPWAVVLATAAVRGAYRPPPTWSRVAVASPMGGAPPTGGLTKGVDVALVGTLPTAVALYVGSYPPLLVAAQWTMAAVLVAALVGLTARKG